MTTATPTFYIISLLTDSTYTLDNGFTATANNPAVAVTLTAREIEAWMAGVIAISPPPTGAVPGFPGIGDNPTVPPSPGPPFPPIPQPPPELYGPPPLPRPLGTTRSARTCPSPVEIPVQTLPNGLPRLMA